MIVKNGKKLLALNHKEPTLKDIQFMETNHYNPKEMLKRLNFPNPQKVQNLNYIQVASVEMFDKMFEELTKDEKQKLFTALTQKFSLPFTDQHEQPIAYPKKVKQTIRKKMNRNVTIAHENSPDFIEWTN